MLFKLKFDDKVVEASRICDNITNLCEFFDELSDENFWYRLSSTLKQKDSVKNYLVNKLIN